MAAIDNLFKTPANSRDHFERRYDAETLAKYEKDLRFVVEQVKAGQREPSLASLRRHFAEEHGIAVTGTSIRIHLNKLKAGENLWQKSNS